MLSATTLSLTPTTSSGTPAALSPAQLAQETAIAQSINAFGLELYASLQATPGAGNLLISPTSISAALAMAYAGANGETATQMAQVLHFTGDSGATEKAFGTLLTDLNSATQGSNNTLSIADALWGQQGMQILAPFLETMQSDFSGALRQIDFQSDPAGATQMINQWVAGQTDGYIKNLIPAGDITQLTRLVLVNAVYFNADWASPFNLNDTHTEEFTLPSGTTTQVSMMNQTAGFGYMDEGGFQVVDIPYAGGRFSMDVILPDQGNSTSSLNVGQLPANLTSWLGGLQRQQVDLSLPEFNMNTSFDLASALSNLGMTDAFTPGVANFSGITNPLENPLYITHVVHQATINVNETGTVATAATAVIASDAIAVGPPTFNGAVFDANHPFLFLIRDDQSGAILFMGQETDPPPPSSGGSSGDGPTGNSGPTTGPTSVHGGHALGALGEVSGTQGGHNQIVPAGIIGGSSTGGFNYVPPSETPPASGGSSKTGSASSSGEKNTRVVFTPVETVFSEFDPSEFLFGV